MPRPTRRSAGNRVLARAQSLSDDLLVAEEECFARVQDVFTATAPAVDKMLTAGWRRAKKDIAALTRDARLQSDLLAAHQGAIAQTRVFVAFLAETSVAWSLDAIADELGWCEETVAKRYAGTANLGVAHARTVAGDLTVQTLSIHAQSETAALLWFGDQMRGQLLLAAQAGDDIDVVRGRILSPTPFRARGIGGRGIWHRTGSDVNASARGVCVGLMNRTRQAAMAGMNEAARAR